MPRGHSTPKTMHATRIAGRATRGRKGAAGLRSSPACQAVVADHRSNGAPGIAARNARGQEDAMGTTSRRGALRGLGAGVLAALAAREGVTQEAGPGPE